jgi:hypothetical protein
VTGGPDDAFHVVRWLRSQEAVTVVDYVGEIVMTASTRTVMIHRRWQNHEIVVGFVQLFQMMMVVMMMGW